MSGIYLTGLGAVSPAGWGMAALRDSIEKDVPLAPLELERPGDERKLRVLRVPPPNPRPSFLGHARLRRASSISHFAMASVLEAVGDLASAKETAVIACVFSGCVNYSRRFYGETLHDPATASPLLFPETVFNAPASHISAYLGSNAINYTLVGDAGTMLTGLALGARWLLEGKAERCVVVGTEEIDWLTADALHLFDRSKCLSEGAGAVLLAKEPAGRAAQLERITDECLYHAGGKSAALRAMNSQLGSSSPDAWLFDSTSGDRGLSKDELALWSDWPGKKISPKKVLGEGLMASAAWQLVLAADTIRTGQTNEANISIAGFHQHTVGARLVAPH